MRSMKVWCCYRPWGPHAIPGASGMSSLPTVYVCVSKGNKGVFFSDTNIATTNTHADDFRTRITTLADSNNQVRTVSPCWLSLHDARLIFISTC
jgi:hypothetical protein